MCDNKEDLSLMHTLLKIRYCNELPDVEKKVPYTQWWWTSRNRLVYLSRRGQEMLEYFQRSKPEETSAMAAIYQQRQTQCVNG